MSMFEPGSIIIVAGPPRQKDYCLVHVARNYGPIKGVGWLVRSEEGNVLVVTGSDQYVANVVFVLEAAMIEGLIFLTNHPEAVNDLSKFTDWLKDKEAISSFFGAVSQNSPDPE